jgi:hypothetical protein
MGNDVETAISRGVDRDADSNLPGIRDAGPVVTEVVADKVTDVETAKTRVVTEIKITNKNIFKD